MLSHWLKRFWVVIKQRRTEITIVDDKNFRVRKSVLKLIVFEFLSVSNKIFNRLSINFVESEKLFDLNKKFLNHNTDTDIITFSYTESEPFETEIFISYKMAKINAQKFNISIEDEILRLIIHGILHTIGFRDKTSKQKKIIREEENKILTKLKKKKFIEKMNLGSVSH
ncbi:MAG: rRNA maturation RNase YbeY [Ignavibacteria bacterium]|nr:rRNA maturation RNase YbeY [Ignavibacteria bacterium]